MATPSQIKHRMSQKTIQIKRYPNRRFYDRNASKYISQEDIEKLVRDGNQVEIHDSPTGEDITRSVLTRIILERQPDKMALFPTAMLHFILRANEVSSSFLRDYFQHSLTYLDYFSQHSSTSSSFARPMHWAKAWLDSIAPQPPKQQAPQPEEGADVSQEEAVRLARRVEELEKRIAQLESQEV